MADDLTNGPELSDEELDKAFAPYREKIRQCDAADPPEVQEARERHRQCVERIHEQERAAESRGTPMNDIDAEVMLHIAMTFGHHVFCLAEIGTKEGDKQKVLALIHEQVQSFSRQLREHFAKPDEPVIVG